MSIGGVDGVEWKPCWVVVNAQAHREFVAASNLKKQGYQIYAPVIRKTTRHARMSRESLAPLFPGYLFARWTAPDMRWRPILSTVGIRSIVRNGDEPKLPRFGVFGVLICIAGRRHAFFSSVPDLDDWLIEG